MKEYFCMNRKLLSSFVQIFIWHLSINLWGWDQWMPHKQDMNQTQSLHPINESFVLVIGWADVWAGPWYRCFVQEEVEMRQPSLFSSVDGFLWIGPYSLILSLLSLFLCLPPLSPGSCQPIMEPQCHMLPYNQTWLSSSTAVVKSSEVDMLLRRVSCLPNVFQTWWQGRRM